MEENGTVSSPAVQVLDGSEKQLGVIQTVNEAWLAIDEQLLPSDKSAMGCIKLVKYLSQISSGLCL